MQQPQGMFWKWLGQFDSLLQETPQEASLSA
jgi:hypothetical protein